MNRLAEALGRVVAERDAPDGDDAGRPRKT